MTRKKRTTSFKGKVGNDARRQKAAASSYGYLKLPQGVNVYKEEPGGRAWLDFLPYEVSDTRHPDRNEDADIAVEGSLWYKRPFITHRNIGVENDTIICPTSFGKKCPICEYRAKRISEGADKEETDAIKQSKRVLYVVIPKKSKNHEAVPHIWDISHYLFQGLLNDELEENEDYEVFPGLEDGLTLRIRFDSKTIGKSQPFAEASRIDFEERDDIYEEDILDDVPDLDIALKVLSYSELKNKFFEMEDEDEDTQDEPEEKEDRTTRKRPSKTLKSEDDEPEETKQEDPEPEEKPEKKATSSRRRERPKKKEEGNKCPYGHVFGKDCDEKPDCTDCGIWAECADEQDALKG